MKLTLPQAIEEVKWIWKHSDDLPAITKCYGSKERSVNARVKIGDFLEENGYCRQCYEKQESSQKIDSGLCDSCWKEIEEAHGIY